MDIMEELIKLSRDIGAIKGRNKITNFFYTKYKKRKLNEIIKMIDDAPAILQDYHMLWFANRYPILTGMDWDGDIDFVNTRVGITGGCINVAYNTIKISVYAASFPDIRCQNSCHELSADIDLRLQSIVYSATLIGTATSVATNNIDSKMAAIYVSAFIKEALIKLCTELILGGR